MKKPVILSALAAAMLLSGCESRSAVPAETPDGDTGAGVQIVEAVPDTRLQDGERFETVILLEGTEETVGYEHARSDALGFELDYEYESLVRRGDESAERFLSVYDQPGDPWNYLELTRDAAAPELAAAALSATLAGSYSALSTQPAALARAGECLRIDASGAADGSLQTVYVIPAAGGSLIAAVHCTYESAEGFGARFAQMLETLTLLG